jgi:pre-mRNA-processing factor 40
MSGINITLLTWFQDLLNELVNDGKIKPGTKWKHIYSSVAYDERYTNILGNPGSNPLELFWDVVDGLDQKLEAKVAVAEEAIKRYNEQFMVEDGASAEAFVFKVGPDTSEEAFLQILKADNNPGVKNLGEEEMKEIFRSVCSYFSSNIQRLMSFQMHETVLKQHADEKRRAERKLRHLQDDLRYALKKLPEPLDVNLSYEEVRGTLFVTAPRLTRYCVGCTLVRTPTRVQSAGGR